MSEVEGRRRRLAELHDRIRVCRLCPLSESRILAAPGEGPLDAIVMFIGEAPGHQEDLAGRPFVGPSGRYLDELLTRTGLSRNDVFITGTVKCRPPKNRTPRRPEIDACHPYLRAQIEIVRPKIIVLLGKVALAAVLGESDLAGLHGKVIERGGIPHLPTYHPAAAMRFPGVREKTLADFDTIAALVRRYRGTKQRHNRTGGHP